MARPTGPEKLAVLTKINEAYLLTVEQPCIHLQEARGHSRHFADVASSQSPPDFVNFGN